jgi:DNA repair exonuclease SbcCD ATPase subunit
MISNSGVSSILKGSVQGESSSIIVSTHSPTRKTQYASSKGSFESSSTLDVSQSSNKCFVCGKGFTLRKKHFCKFCQNTVCSDHSSKTRMKNGFAEPQRICDFCEQEEAKKDIKNEINDELNKLGDELSATKDTNERLNREFFEKTSVLNEIEKKATVAEMAHSRKMGEMRMELEGVREKTRKMKSELDGLRKNLQNTKDIEVELNDKCGKFEGEMKKLEERVGSLKESKGEMGAEIEKLNRKLKNTIVLDSLSKSLCARCNARVNDAFGKIKNTNYWMEENAEEEKL